MKTTKNYCVVDGCAFKAVKAGRCDAHKCCDNISYAWHGHTEPSLSFCIGCIKDSSNVDCGFMHFNL